MGPKVKRRARQPLAAAPAVMREQNQIKPTLIEIFNMAQHVASSDTALTQIIKLHKTTSFDSFEEPFINLIKKLLQSEQNVYFKTCCDFLCKFLRHVSNMSEQFKSKNPPCSASEENMAPRKKMKVTGTKSRGRQTGADNAPKRGSKRKAPSDGSDDEILMDVLSTTQADSDSDDDLISAHLKEKTTTTSQANSSLITDYDRLISSCIDVAVHYMQVLHDGCRLNAVLFVSKFLTQVESLDEEIYNSLRKMLPLRVRDKKANIRAQAVIASRKFQDCKLTQDAFNFHFYRDPELVVRRALLQIMDTKVFGYEFLVDSTQDVHENMRKYAYQRLGKLNPEDLTRTQLHRVIHNGLYERDRAASYSFKSNTLEPWLKVLYDGLNLYKLFEFFDVLNYHEDMFNLLGLIHEKNVDKPQNNGTTTTLHLVAEQFRDSWLASENLCLPSVDQMDERVVIIWLSLVGFCKENRSIIKSIKIRPVPAQLDESIEKILDSQEKDDEVVELYERLTPDLVNLINFLHRFVQHSHNQISKNKEEAPRLEFIYQKLMNFILTYEIGDELERKTVQEVFGQILKENLLTGFFDSFIPPIIKCLHVLIYSSSPTLMINYISELINDVKSHLEDIVTSTQRQATNLSYLTPAKAPKSAKKVRINTQAQELTSDPDRDNIEYKIATIRVEIEELRDKLDVCVSKKDFDMAKTINNRISDLKDQLSLLNTRRSSMAADVSHMSMIIETEPGAGKLSSTMIGNVSISESQQLAPQEDVKIFKHHTNELLKCLQMYFGCLQNVKVQQVPQTMVNLLSQLNYEALDDWFKGNHKVRSLMVGCNGLTAIIDKEFARNEITMTLLISACFDKSSMETRTMGFKSIVDVIIQHQDIEAPLDKVEVFLKQSLRDYGKYDPSDQKKIELDFTTAVVEGATKLYYFKRISSPEVLSHLILWWYHPRTHPKLKQFIGIWLPIFVDDTLTAQLSSDDDLWFKDLWAGTFVKSLEYLHDYISGPGFNIMAASDIYSLISFLSNLIPISFHQHVLERVEEKIEELCEASSSFSKYLKQARSSLTSTKTVINNENQFMRRALDIE